MLKQGTLFVVAVCFLATALCQTSNIKEARAELHSDRVAYNFAKRRFEKHHADQAYKHAYVIATVKLATATMLSPILVPKVKYPGALRLYREALKVDPTNFEARNNSRLIISIYKEMGRPIPK